MKIPDFPNSNALNLTGFVPPSPKIRLTLSLIVWGIYLLAFTGLYKTFSMSAEVAALAIIPVAVTGGLCGLRQGFVAGLLSVPVNTLLLNWVEHIPGGWNAAILSGGATSSIITIIAGIITGWFHDLRWQLRQHLAERAAIEQALQDSEARIRRILESALDAIIVINQAGIISEWSSQAEVIFGWRRDEVIGKTLTETIIPSQYHQAHKQGLEHFLATQEGKILNRRTELLGLRRDGREIPLELSISALRSGDHWLFSAFVRDITRRKQAEAERDRLLANEREQRQLSEILLEAGAELSTSLNYNTVLDRVLDLIVQVIPYDSANITLVENGQTRITRMHGYEQYGQEVVEFISTLSFEISAIDHLRQMVESKQPFIIANTATYPGWETHNRPAFIGSWLGAPIVSHGRVIAFFSLDKKEPGFYQPKHAERLAIFAGQVALALENADLFEQTQIALVRREGLYQATQTLITLKDLSSMLQSFVNQIAEILPANRVSLIMLDLQQQKIKDIIIGGAGASDFIPFTFDDFWHSLTGWAIRHKQPALSPKGKLDPRQSEWMQKRRMQKDTGCMLIVPLRYQDEVFGAMAAVNRFDEPDFTQQDVDLILAVANQAAAAIQNTRLFQANQEARRLSDSLREIGASLTATLNIDEVLDRVLDSLGKVIPYDSTSLMLIEGDTLKIRAGRGLPENDLIWSQTFVIHENSADLKIYQSKKPLIIPDVHQDSQFTEIEGTEYIRSWLGIPLIARDEVIGILNLDHTQPGFYTEEHASTAMVFAQQAAIAIENARLFDETYHHMEQLAILNELAGEMTGLLGLEELCATTARRLQMAFGYYNVSILTVDTETQELVLQFNAGAYADLIQPGKYRQKIGQGLMGKAAQTGEIILVNDTQQHPNFFELKQLSIRAEIAIPLKVEQRVVGILNIDSDQPHAFVQNDVAVLSTIADQLAVALEKANLFTETRQRTEQLEALRQISQDLTLLRDLKLLLRQIIQQAIRLLNGNSGGIYLYNPDQQVLEWAVDFGNIQLPTVPPIIKSDEGLVGKVWTSEQPLLINDYKNWSGKAKFRADNLPEAVIGAPIKWGQNFLGVIAIDSMETGRHFTYDHVILLSQFATHAAVAIENAHLYDEAHQRLAELEIIRQASLNLTSSLEPQVVLETILENALSLITDAHNAHIFLYQDERLMFGAAMYQDGRKSEPFSEPRPEGLTYTVARQGELVVVVNMRTHPLFADASPDWQGAIVGLPLKIGQRVVGVMNISCLQPRNWTDAELRVLCLLADQAAIAVENARLFEAEHIARQQAETLREETRQHLSLITRLYELSTEFVSTLSLSETANLVIEKVRQVTNAHSAVIKLLDKAGNFEQDFGAPGEAPPRPDGTTITIAKTGRPLLAGDTQKQPNMLNPSLKNKGIKAFIGLPLRTGANTIGALFVRYDTPQSFSARVVESLYIFANQAAMAIQNARWREEEQLIQQRAQQQERMAAVGQLAAGIAHDFNNILTSIIGYAELLSYDPSLSDPAKEDLNRITNQGQRAAHLVRQILDFSRQTISAKHPLDLFVFLKETVKLLKRTIPEAIHISLQARLGEYGVSADVTQIQQALTNLAVNARDAMPAGGELRFELSQFELLSEQDAPHPDMTLGKWIVLEVIDTGSGIPPEHRDKIFEPFFTTKEVGQGTGLGLAQVYGIIRQHDGFIGVKSEVGAGSTFTLYLPALPANSQTLSGTSTMSDLPLGQGEVILLVEDNPQVITVVSVMLQRLGYQVLTATNGSEALQTFNHHRQEIALVLTDMTMPKMGGTELATALRELDPELKIIVLTGYPLDSQAPDNLKGRFSDWLEKPVNISQLAQVIYKHL